jgi:hypothetical protein
VLPLAVITLVALFLTGGSSVCRRVKTALDPKRSTIHEVVGMPWGHETVSEAARVDRPSRLHCNVPRSTATACNCDKGG